MTSKMARWLPRVMAMAVAVMCLSCRDDPSAIRHEADSRNSHRRNTSDHPRTPLRHVVQRESKQARMPVVTGSVVPNAGARAIRSTAEAASGTSSGGQETPGGRKFLQAGVFSVPSPSGPTSPRTTLVAFESSAFPYNGTVPTTHRPFLDVNEGERKAHRTGGNRVYWQDEKYADPRVLIHIPRGFDIDDPGVMVVFFHGHGATLERDVQMRQQVPVQISESGINAVLVAPQLAVDARDSSAGKFWEPGGLKRFVDEAADKLAKVHGDPRAREKFARMPVIIVAYSGGYMATAWSLERGGLGKRVRGVVLLDALYGDLDKFANWITRQRGNSFFISSYAASTRAHNVRLERILGERGIEVSNTLGPRLRQGSVVFLPVSQETRHRDFVTHAWIDHPIKDVLQRVALASR